MARVTRSGTLVGPGTKRKWRPAMMNPPFVRRLTLLTKPLAQAQQPKLRARSSFTRPAISKLETGFGQGHATMPRCLASAKDQDGAEIVYIGEGWPGHHQISNRRKETVTIVAGEPGPGRYAGRGRADKAVGADERARVVLRAVDSIGVRGEGIDAGMAIQGDAKRQQELCVAAAPPGPADGDRGLAPRDEDAGRRRGLAEAVDLPRDRRVHQSHVARLALDGVGQNKRGDAGLARDFGRGL